MLIKIDKDTIINLDNILMIYKSPKTLAFVLEELEYDTEFKNEELCDKAEKAIIESYKRDVKFCDISKYSKKVE